MNLLEVIRVALLDLALHKFRSLLAVLGIIFGVASVEGMISISEGAKQAALSKFTELGIDNILVRSVRPTRIAAGDSGGSRGQYSVAEFGLLRRDFDHIRDTFPMVRHIVGAREARKSLYSQAGGELELSVLATEPEFLDVTRSRVQRGRFLAWADQVDRKRVAVAGAEAARKIFGFVDPLGRQVRIGGDWYELVGVLDNRDILKAQGGEDIDNCVFIPLAVAQMEGDVSFTDKAGGTDAVRVELDGIYVQLADAEAVLGTADRLRSYLAATHKTEDYALTVPLAQMRQKEEEQRRWSLVMGSIAGISLVVGGIGITNIMLANVSDRRKEIGTRRALGARRGDIMLQFVLQAGALTSLGGLVGVGLGYAVALWIADKGGFPTVVTPYSVALGVISSTAVGIIFGYWPARQAARVNPIEALRAD